MNVESAPRNLCKISTSISRVGLHTSGLATYVETFSHFGVGCIEKNDYGNISLRHKDEGGLVQG
jgi:hypothetical protein